MTDDSAGDLSLATGLVRLAHLVQNVFAEVAARHRLPPAQARLLCILVPQPRGMAELSSILGVEKAALTGLVDRIESRGLAERKSVPGDRRALRVTLTSDGERAAIALHDEVSAEVIRLADTLAGPDRERLRALLSQVVAANAVPPVFSDPA